MSELASLAQAAEEIARIDSAALTEALTAQRRALGAQAALDTEKQGLLAAREQVESVTASLSAVTDERSAVLDELTTEIARLEQEARERALAARLAAAEAAEAASLDEAFLEALEPDASGAGPAQNLPDGFAATGVSFEGRVLVRARVRGRRNRQRRDLRPQEVHRRQQGAPLRHLAIRELRGPRRHRSDQRQGPLRRGAHPRPEPGRGPGGGTVGVGWVEIEILIKTS